MKRQFLRVSMVLAMAGMIGSAFTFASCSDDDDEPSSDTTKTEQTDDTKTDDTKSEDTKTDDTKSEGSDEEEVVSPSVDKASIASLMAGVTQGQVVTITGANLDMVKSIKLDGKDLTPTVSEDKKSLTITIPENATTGDAVAFEIVTTNSKNEETTLPVKSIKVSAKDDGGSTESGTINVEPNLGKYNSAWLLDGTSTWTFSTSTQYIAIQLGATVKKADYKALKLSFDNISNCQLVVTSPEGTSQWGSDEAVNYVTLSNDFELDFANIGTTVKDYDKDAKAYKEETNEVVNVTFLIQSTTADASCKVTKAVLVDNSGNETALYYAPASGWTTAETNPMNTVQLSAKYASCYIFSEFAGYKSYDVEIDGTVPEGLVVSCNYKQNGETKYSGAAFTDGKASFDLTTIPEDATDFTIYLQNSGDSSISFKVKSVTVTK